jgi:hypothetical protein
MSSRFRAQGNRLFPIPPSIMAVAEPSQKRIVGPADEEGRSLYCSVLLVFLHDLVGPCQQDGRS